MLLSHRPTRSLRTHIAILFGSFCAALAIVLCVMAGEWLKFTLQQQAGAQLHLVAHNTATVLNEDLAQQSRNAQAMAQARELQQHGLDSRSASDMLGRVQQVHPHNVWMGIADMHGIVQNATGNLLRGSNVSQRPWFQAALHGDFISEVHPAKLLEKHLPLPGTGEPLRLIDFSAPIYSADGQPLGVLGIHTSWEWVRTAVETLLQGTAKESHQSIFIFDAKGELIYAPDGVMAPYTNLGQTLPREISSTGAQPMPVMWEDASTPFLSAAVRLPAPSAAHDLGWWIVARQPLSTAYAAANRVLWIALGAGLLTGLLAMAIAWRLARHASEDMKKLAHAASTDDAIIPLLHSNREVQQLSQALADMTDKLRGANAHMQEQVRLRTLQLEQANTELARANAELDRQANTDPLTQLLNRRGFEIQAQWACAMAQRNAHPVSVLTLDIDFFKQVNDRYGHDIGDAVLQTLARTLRQRVRQTDVLARFGGEEFVLLLPDTNAEGALHTAQQLVATIPAIPMPAVGHITVSIGVSTWMPDTPLDLPDQLKRSDAALYRAKQTGRNRACAAQWLVQQETAPTEKQQ